MPDTWRIIVKGGTAEDREAFKEAHFKKLFDTSGDSVTFEVPEHDEAGADALAKEAEKAGLEAVKEKFEDPLDQAGSVDFW